MGSILSFRDTVAQTIFKPNSMHYYNTEIGQVATLDVIYDYSALRASIDRDAYVTNRICSMWRYHELLPLPIDCLRPPLAVGWTPLYNAPRLATNLGFRECHVKDDGLNPTGSLKDRASAMVVALALEMNAPVASNPPTGAATPNTPATSPSPSPSASQKNPVTV